MNITDETNALIDRFEQAVAEADRTRRPTDGLLGIGQKPGDAPCNAAFDQSVAALFAGLDAPDTPAADLAGAVEALFRADEGRRWPDYARWTLLAAQRYALPLIPRLPAADAGRLRAWYEQKWPRRMRLPLQKQVLSALRKAEASP